MGLGVAGIAIAFSTGSILNFLLLYILMCRKCEEGIFDWWNVLKMILSGIFMYLSLTYVGDYVSYGGRLIDRMGTLALLTLVGMLSYFLAARILKIPELKMIVRK